MSVQPPWVVFYRGDGLADILPAGRRGEVAAKLDRATAHKIVNAANAGFWDNATAELNRLTAEVELMRAPAPRCDGECGSSPGAGCEAADLRGKP